MKRVLSTLCRAMTVSGDITGNCRITKSQVQDLKVSTKVDNIYIKFNRKCISYYLAINYKWCVIVIKIWGHLRKYVFNIFFNLNFTLVCNYVLPVVCSFPQAFILSLTFFFIYPSSQKICIENIFCTWYYIVVNRQLRS